VTEETDAPLRTSESFAGHARVLKAQFMVPDDEGIWTVTFSPGFVPQEADFVRMSEGLEAIPGVQIAERRHALRFSLDCSGKYDPEKALNSIGRLLHIARRDHVIVTQQLDEESSRATVTLLFRKQRTAGQLLDMADAAARMNGVLTTEPTDENEITLELNAHYATPHGVQLVAAGVAARAGAHVLKIITEEAPRQRSLVASPGLPAPWLGSPPPAGLPPLAVPLPRTRQRRRVALYQQRRAALAGASH